MLLERSISLKHAVGIIAAEDTRKTRILLSAYDIKTPLTSYHEHNEKSKARELVDKLKAGQTVALITDAGYTMFTSEAGYDKMIIDATQPIDKPFPSMFRVPPEAVKAMSLQEWLDN